MKPPISTNIHYYWPAPRQERKREGPKCWRNEGTYFYYTSSASQLPLPSSFILLCSRCSRVFVFGAVLLTVLSTTTASTLPLGTYLLFLSLPLSHVSRLICFAAPCYAPLRCARERVGLHCKCHRLRVEHRDAVLTRRPRPIRRLPRPSFLSSACRSYHSSRIQN